MDKLKLRKRVNKNGSVLISWHCLECGSWAMTPIKWFKHIDIIEYLKKFDADINDIPIIDESEKQLCAVCGSSFTEYHHWAPKHIFGDEAEKWPGSELCKNCHNDWHMKVTPNMCVK